MTHDADHPEHDSGHHDIGCLRAIEAFYGVEVDSVRTLIVRGKVKRFGRRFGKRKNWKKAYVRVAAGQEIDFMVTD